MEWSCSAGRTSEPLGPVSHSGHRPAGAREPAAALATLQQSWSERQPLVVELAVDSKHLQERETCHLPVHDLSPRFEFTRERLHFLLWANNYDARSGEPIWWHGRKAIRSFATQGVTESGLADIELADGTPLFVDGGPFAPTRDADGIRVVHRWNTEAGSLSTVGHRPPEADLASDQLAAVSHRAGGARVIAPAGSGKTRVLTERLRYLIDERGADPSTVTVLAYNKKAADELRERCGRSRHCRRSPHPDTQQRRALHLQRVRRSGTHGRLGGAAGTRPGAERLRGPTTDQHRYRAPLHRRALSRSTGPDVSGRR